MDKKRTSEQIDNEIQAERETIKKLQRELEATKKEQSAAEAAQEQLAYRALAEGDKAAQKSLDEAEEKLTKAEKRIRSREKAIAEGMRRFESLQSEYERVYKVEQWEQVLSLAAGAEKEAEQIDVHIDGLSKFLAQHQQKIEDLKRRSNNLGFPRAFETCGVRHVFRIMDWRLIQAGVSSETEKPSPAYRSAKGYAEIFGQQVEAAKARAATQNSGAAEAEAPTGTEGAD